MYILNEDGWRDKKAYEAERAKSEHPRPKLAEGENVGVVRIWACSLKSLAMPWLLEAMANG